eukprot:4440159-Amphidinium_carterae.2
MMDESVAPARGTLSLTLRKAKQIDPSACCVLANSGPSPPDHTRPPSSSTDTGNNASILDFVTHSPTTHDSPHSDALSALMPCLLERNVLQCGIHLQCNFGQSFVLAARVDACCGCFARSYDTTAAMEFLLLILCAAEKG